MVNTFQESRDNVLSQKIIDMLNDIITDDLAKEFGEDSKDAVINKLVNYNPDSYNLIHKIREYSQKKMGDVLNELVMSDSSQESLLRVKQKATNISFLYDIVMLSIQQITIESMEEKYFGKKNKGLK
jgi:hypothetical protein